MDNSKQIRDNLNRVQRLLKGGLASGIGGKAVTHFKKSFIDGGFTDEKLDPWEEVKRHKSKGGTRSMRESAILVRTGALRNSIRITKRDKDSVTIGTSIDYAKYHNEGTEKIPKRQFMGKSKKLEAELRQYIEKKLDFAQNLLK